MTQQPKPFKQGGEPLLTGRLSEVIAMMKAQQPIPFKQAVVPYTAVPPAKIQAFEHKVMASQNSFLVHRLNSHQFHSVHANQRLHLLSSNHDVQHQTDRIPPLVGSQMAKMAFPPDFPVPVSWPRSDSLHETTATSISTPGRISACSSLLPLGQILKQS